MNSHWFLAWEFFEVRRWFHWWMLWKDYYGVLWPWGQILKSIVEHLKQTSKKFPSKYISITGILVLTNLESNFQQFFFKPKKLNQDYDTNNQRAREKQLEWKKLYTKHHYHSVLWQRKSARCMYYWFLDRLFLLDIYSNLEGTQTWEINAFSSIYALPNNKVYKQKSKNILH